MPGKTIYTDKIKWEIPPYTGQNPSEQSWRKIALPRSVITIVFLGVYRNNAFFRYTHHELFQAKKFRYPTKYKVLGRKGANKL